ncbi:MAG: HAD family hydrolase [Thermodesulfobacteriota bacterium]
MIKALIFDMDGTLVQTEELKAESYAKAAVELKPTLSEHEVLEAFKDFVGLSRKEVSESLIKRFGIEELASVKMKELHLDKPWQAYAKLRMGIYDNMISDPEVLNKLLCPYNLGLLQWARVNGYHTALGTQSHRPQTLRILEILNIRNEFDFIATREDVENPKPDPEIYLLLANELDVTPAESLVIEDSSTGVQAALSAGMGCIAVTTDFTRQGVYKMKNMEKRWIVDSPPRLLEIAKEFIAENEVPGVKAN